jgi:hypothetical protein
MFGQSTGESLGANAISGLVGASLTPYVSSVNVSKAENGFTASVHGVTRVFTDFDSMVADLKSYFQV